jgi:hypothetical protein
MTRETTRRVNQQVVEALESAARAAEDAHMGWNRVLSQMVILEGLTSMHKDIVLGGFDVSYRMGQFREDLLNRLRAEQDGDGR